MPRREVLEVPGVRHTAPIPMAVAVGNMVFTSAIMGKDPATGALPADPEAQAAWVFAHLRTILRAAGCHPGDVGHVAVLVADEAYRRQVDREWLAMFPDERDRPARHTTVTQLRGGALIQIEAVAVRDQTTGEAQ
jgi:2-iminobutanoate/2-iminopropanoate deaminase